MSDPSARHLDAEAAAWREHSRALAHWAVRLLVNVPVVHGQYRPLDDRPVHPQTGRPQVAWTRNGDVTASLLERHFRGADVGHLVGLHAIGVDADGIGFVCRWAALDFDNHGPDDRAARNVAMAQDLLARVRGLGITALLFDSDGRGGLHLVMPFGRPVPAAPARRLVKWLAEGATEPFGLPEPPDLFPHDAKLGPKGYSTWLRLPGRHHTRDHWTRVYDLASSAWLAGGEAVAAILAAGPAAVDLAAVLPREAPPAVGRDVDREELVGLGPVERAYVAARARQLKVKDVRADADGEVVAFYCQCPCHQECSPSASFRKGEAGQAWGKCFGGDCQVTTRALFAALGLEPQDIFPTRHYELRKAARLAAAGRDAGRSRPRPTRDPQPSRRDVEDRQAERFAEAVSRAQEELDGKPEKLALLSGRLGVSVAALGALGVGWREDREPAGDIFRRTGRWAWILPEFDGRGRCVGYMRRYEDPALKKKRAYGGRPGLYLPVGWRERPGTLMIVEGGSDVAAALDLGWSAIGRADAGSGLEDLRILLAGETREVAIVPDNDPHAGGLKGAERLARGLAEALGRDVRVMPLPGRFKDIREYKRALDARRETSSHGRG